MTKTDGPHWVKAWISSMAIMNDQFRDESGQIDFEALGREEYAYRMAMIRHDFTKSSRAKADYEEALKTYQIRASNGRKGGRPRKTASTESQVPQQPTAKQVAPVGKNTYGEFANVFLTTEEYLRLQSDFQEALDYVERLSAYLANNPGKAYANHYAAIRKWIAEDRQKAKEAEANRPKSFKEQERDRIRLLFADDEAVKRYKGEA